jgi:hypothetical protein
VKKVGIPVIGIAIVGIIRVIIVWIIKIGEGGGFGVNGTLLLDLRALDQMTPLQHQKYPDGNSYPRPRGVQFHRATLKVESKCCIE